MLLPTLLKVISFLGTVLAILIVFSTDFLLDLDIAVFNTINGFLYKDPKCVVTCFTWTQQRTCICFAG